MFKEKLAALWAKIVENKEELIRVSGVMLGAAIGAGIATLIAEVSEDSLMEEMVMVPLDEEEIT